MVARPDQTVNREGRLDDGKRGKQEGCRKKMTELAAGARSTSGDHLDDLDPIAGREVYSREVRSADHFLVALDDHGLRSQAKLIEQAPCRDLVGDLGLLAVQDELQGAILTDDQVAPSSGQASQKLTEPPIRCDESKSG